MVASVSSLTSFSASMRLVKNETEISGSQTANSFTTASTITAGSAFPLTNSIIAVLAAGDVIMVQALGNNAQLAPTGSGTTRPTAGIVMVRLA